MPTLLLSGSGLVKTRQFTDEKYLGDPRNTVRIFNEKEVDELVLLDIKAGPESRGPDFGLVKEIVSEAFMPVGYGGGLRRLEDCRRMLALGVEKVILNTAAVDDLPLVRAASDEFGSQSVVVSIDARRNTDGSYESFVDGGRRKTGLDPVTHARRAEDGGAGELIITSIDRDGMMTGYDLTLIHSVSSAVAVPVVASGGAGSVADLVSAIRDGGSSAAAAGSMFVFQGRHRAVLISFPSQDVLRNAFDSH